MDQLVNEFIMYIQQNEIEKANVVFEKILGQLEKEDAQVMAQTGYSLAQLGFIQWEKTDFLRKIHGSY